MPKFAVIKTGGKQYLVRENDELYVDQREEEAKKKINLDTLAVFEEKKIELGKPLLEKKVEALIVGNFKGDKIRVAKFKAKSRYRRVMGFRPKITKLKITKI